MNVLIMANIFLLWVLYQVSAEIIFFKKKLLDIIGPNYLKSAD